MGLINQSRPRWAILLTLIAWTAAERGVASRDSNTAAASGLSHRSKVATNLRDRLFATGTAAPPKLHRHDSSRSLRWRIVDAKAASPARVKHHQPAVSLHERLFVAASHVAPPLRETSLESTLSPERPRIADGDEAAAELSVADAGVTEDISFGQGLRRLPPVQLTDGSPSAEISSDALELPEVNTIDRPTAVAMDSESSGPPATPAALPLAPAPSPMHDVLPVISQRGLPEAGAPGPEILITGPPSGPSGQAGQVHAPVVATPNTIEADTSPEWEAAQSVTIVWNDLRGGPAKVAKPADDASAPAEAPSPSAPLEIIIATDDLRDDSQVDRPEMNHGDAPHNARHEATPRAAAAPIEDELAAAMETESNLEIVRLPSTNSEIDTKPAAIGSVIDQVPIAPAVEPDVQFAEQLPPIEEHRTEPASPLVAMPIVAPVEPMQDSGASPALDGLLLHASEARHHVQQGFGAANRGMLYTARKECLQALQIVAEAKDAARGRRTHMDALASGLAALEEAEKVRHASTAVANVDVSMLVSTHRTPVLKGQDVSEMLPLAVIDKYHEYASQQLGNAMAGDPSGSMALYALARIYEHLGSENGADRVARSRQAVAFHEAAVLACPENHLAAHELGVVLARLGRTDKAMEMLTRSIQLAPTSVAYRNLALVSRQLGKQQAASVAEQYAAQLAKHEEAAGEDTSRVALLDPSEFARTSDRGGFSQSIPPSTAPEVASDGGGTSPEAQPPDPSPTIVDRLAAPLKALAPESWLNSTRK